MPSTPAPALWDHLIQWQPATAAALVEHLRALPDDWPTRTFGVGRPDAALALPPGATGEQYPDRAPEIAPYDEIASPETCPACTEAGENCRWHEGYSAGHHERTQTERDAVKARPDITLAAFLAWRADVAEAEDRGEEPPELPAPAASDADRAEADAERRDRWEARMRQIPGWSSGKVRIRDAAIVGVAVADAEQADLRTQLARVRSVADAIDTEMRTEPDTLRAAMQQEAVVRIRAALDGYPLHGGQQAVGRTPDSLRDDVLRALDFNFCVGVLGYGSPEALLDAYDASRAAAPSAPASPAPLAARLPLVQGRCPACGTEGLFLGDGGYVTCSVRECPEPDAASTVLERQAAAAQPPADRDLRGRIAQALVRYDWNAGLSGRDTPSEHHYGEADAVLAALPAPADRAAVLREAADAIEGITFAPDPVRPTFVAACLAIHLRRMAGEAQQATPSVADADDPTQLRWGLGDVLYGDDDTTTVLMSGPAGEPYWLELDPDRAAALRDSLTSPDEAQQAGEVR